MSAELRFKLRREFGDWDDSFDEPNMENAYGEFGDFQLVGHGKVTNGYCGRFRTFYGCSRVELHNKTIFVKKGEEVKVVDCRGKAYVKRVYCSCDKPSCPICYKYGWSVREARKIELRLREASKKFGLVEHVVASVPAKDYGLNYEYLRKKVVKVLRARGVVGGVLIFHGFRYNKRKSWHWSPHFHVLGYLLSGYKCRGCEKDCEKVGCMGFERKTRMLNEKDGYIVKVLGKRKTVGGTAWYQLNHASIKKGVKRFHVATWFGCCSYRKLKVTVEVKKSVCPICSHDLVKLLYSGFKRYLRDCHGSVKGSCGEVDSFEDVEENGYRVWVEVVERRSGSYEDLVGHD